MIVRKLRTQREQYVGFWKTCMYYRRVGCWWLALCTAVGLFSCNRESTSDKALVRPVRYQKVVSIERVRTRSFSGSAQATVQSKLSFKVAGTVLRLPVDVGDTVTEGQLIAELESEDYQLQVAQADAALKAAEAQERHANAEYTRVQQLYENDNASKSALDAARSASEAATEQVKAMGKQLELARRQLAYTRLKAPSDGAIVIVLTEVGENVGAGMPVVLLSAGLETEVKLAVPENVIASIQEGMRAEVSFSALPGKRFSAVVTEVGVAVTGAMSTYPVTVRLEETDPAIRPGMAAEVMFEFGTRDGGKRIFLLPAAVGEDRQGRYVFILERTGHGLAKAVRRPVIVGEMTNSGLEILEGVADGDLVVTAGVSRIEDGQIVRVPEVRENAE